MTSSGEKIWDGRGDALEDARLTIADGRLADDLRLGVTHFRVMAHVGRQNHKRGWLRVSQSELATRWDCHRNTVNKAFRELVEWGYLWQRTQEDAGESFCLYKVALDNEIEPARTHKTAPKRGGRECTVASAPPGECTSESALGGAAPGVHMCTVQAYTSAHRESAPPYIDTDKPTNADSPPPPRGSRRRGRESEVADWLIAISSPERAIAIESLIAPIIRQRKYDAPDPVFALARLADWAAKLPPAMLIEVRDAVLAERKAIVKAADVEDELSAAIARKKRADELNSGPLVWRNTDEWREVLAEAERINPGTATLWRERDYINRKDIARTLPGRMAAA